MTTPARSRIERIEPFVSALLVLLSVALTLDHVRGDSATIDEPVHVASGVEIVREGTGRWNVEHPPLAKALAGLALTGLPLQPAGDPIHELGHASLLYRFLFDNAAPGDTILFRARLPFALVLAALLLAVRAEARRRWGPLAGGAALALASLEPNLIAHAGVVHTDLCVTLFLVLSLGPLTRLADPADTRAAWHLGLLWGLAFLSKYSAPLLVLVTLPFLFLEGGVKPRKPMIAARIAGAAGLAALVALLGFRLAYRHQTPTDREAVARDRLQIRGHSQRASDLAIALGRRSAPLGNAATGALSILLQSRVGAGVNYFLGSVSKEGSPFYFPVALAAKIPLGLLLAALAGALVPAGRRFAYALGASLLLFFALSAGTTYNIGVRHMLFAFPLAAVAASASATVLFEEGPRRLAVPAGLFLLAVELAFTHPHELSFFNAFAGGLDGGRRLFVDSNLDWGQDLGRLARAGPRYSKEPLPTVVFGGDLPRRYAPALRSPLPGDEDRPGQLLAIGEAPFAMGPELLASKGALREAARMEAIRKALRTRGTRMGEIGGSIGIWRVGAPAPSGAPK